MSISLFRSIPRFVEAYSHDREELHVANIDLFYDLVFEELDDPGLSGKVKDFLDEKHVNVINYYIEQILVDDEVSFYEIKFDDTLFESLRLNEEEKQKLIESLRVSAEENDVLEKTIKDISKIPKVSVSKSEDEGSAESDAESDVERKPTGLYGEEIVLPPAPPPPVAAPAFQALKVKIADREEFIIIENAHWKEENGRLSTIGHHDFSGGDFLISIPPNSTNVANVFTAVVNQQTGKEEWKYEGQVPVEMSITRDIRGGELHENIDHSKAFFDYTHMPLVKLTVKEVSNNGTIKEVKYRTRIALKEQDGKIYVPYVELQMGHSAYPQGKGLLDSTQHHVVVKIKGFVEGGFVMGEIQSFNQSGNSEILEKEIVIKIEKSKGSPTLETGKRDAFISAIHNATEWAKTASQLEMLEKIVNEQRSWGWFKFFQLFDDSTAVTRKRMLRYWRNENKDDFNDEVSSSFVSQRKAQMYQIKDGVDVGFQSRWELMQLARKTWLELIIQSKHEKGALLESSVLNSDAVSANHPWYVYALDILIKNKQSGAPKIRFVEIDEFGDQGTRVIPILSSMSAQKYFTQIRNFVSEVFKLPEGNLLKPMFTRIPPYAKATYAKAQPGTDLEGIPMFSVSETGEVRHVMEVPSDLTDCYLYHPWFLERESVYRMLKGSGVIWE